METADIVVVDAPEESRFEIRVGGELAGYTEYILRGDTHVDFIHTETEPAFAGQGLASRLVTDALDQVRASGKRIIPHCPYVSAFIKKHPEYDDITDWPNR